jgi:hypothetical protein
LASGPFAAAAQFVSQPAIRSGPVARFSPTSRRMRRHFETNMRAALACVLVISAGSCKRRQAAAAWELRGLDRPESVIYDGKRNRFLVSSVGGAADSEDRNGFISAVSADGSTSQLRLFTTASIAAPLNAPRGLAIVEDVLYVADLRRVLGIDLQTGRKVFELIVPGAQMLSDISPAEGGLLYVSDAKANALFRIAPVQNRADRMASSGDLREPRALMQGDAGSMWIACARGVVLHRTRDGGVSVFSSSPDFKELSGIYRLPTGSLLVADAGAGTIYELTTQGVPRVIATGLAAPADFVLHGDLLLVPESDGARLSALTLSRLERS